MSDSVQLKIQATPLQFSDRGQRSLADVGVLFEAGKNYPVKLITQIGTDSETRRELMNQAKKRNHSVSLGFSNAVLVDNSIVEPTSLRRGVVFVGSNAEIAYVSFVHTTPGVGRITALGYHTERPDFNETLNRMVDDTNGEQLFVGAGNASLHGVGQLFSSDAALVQHPDIDDMWTNAVGDRVKVVRFDVLEDSDLRMESSHFVTRGVLEISVGEKKVDPPKQETKKPEPKKVEPAKKPELPKTAKPPVAPKPPEPITLEVPKS